MIGKQITATGLSFERLQETCKVSIFKTRMGSKFPLRSGSTKTSSLITRALSGHSPLGSMRYPCSQMELIFKTIAILCKLDRNGKESSFLFMGTDVQPQITPFWLNYLRKTDMSFVELIKKDLERVKGQGEKLKV